MAREKSEHVTVIAQTGEFGNNTPEPVTATYPKAVRWNVQGCQSHNLMARAAVFMVLNDLSINELGVKAVAAYVKLPADEDPFIEGHGHRKPAMITTPKGIVVEKATLNELLLTQWKLAQVDTKSLTDEQKAAMADVAEKLKAL